MVQKIGSGSAFKDIVGYSRAIRAGNIIEVAGTAALDGNTTVGEGNVYEQTTFLFKKIEQLLKV